MDYRAVHDVQRLCHCGRQHGIDTSHTFLNDKDAPKDKLARYYEHIVKG